MYNICMNSCMCACSNACTVLYILQTGGEQKRKRIFLILENILEKITLSLHIGSFVFFMYRWHILCTLHIVVDFYSALGGVGGWVVRSKYTSYRPIHFEGYWKGWALKVETFSRTIERGGRECPFRALKIQDFQGPPLPKGLEIGFARIKIITSQAI
jgi:hypothetical protein